MAAALMTQCPSCGARIRLKDSSAAGRRIKCRQCEEPFVVKPVSAAKRVKVPPDPDAESSEPGAPATGAKVRSNAPCRRDGADDEFGLGGAGDGLPPRLPRRRSQKKKKPKTQRTEPADDDLPEEPRPRRRSHEGGAFVLSIGGGGLLVIALGIGAWMFFTGGGEPINPPESYAEFEHPINQIFRCEYPADWTPDSGGRRGSVIWARFEKGEAKIRIRQGASGGALGDIMSIGADPNEQDENFTPVAMLHESPFMKDPVAEDFSDYSEQAARSIPGSSGDVRISEFTAAGGWGSKTTGYRATVLGRAQLRIVCSCPESDWEVCRPVFERVLTSIR